MGEKDLKLDEQDLKPALSVGVGTEIDPEEERRVLRKIDRVILPLMCFVYFFQYLDKQSIGYAAVFGLRTDLHLSGNEYSWAISLFYFGQFAAEYPFIYLLSRLPVARFVGATIVVWGIVEMCLAFPHAFGSFGAVRSILGFAEGAVSPAFVLITSTWYKRSEHPLRVAAWVTCNGLAQIIGAIMMYGIGLADSTHMANWRVMFLVCGGGTIICGVVFILLMPMGPTTAWFLTENEKRVAEERLAADRISRDRSSFSTAQMVEALTDYRSWFFFLYGLPVTMPSPVIKFSSLVINGFGWSKFQTMLVGLPAGALQIIFIWIAVLGTRHTNNSRTWWGVGVCLPPLVGNICIMTLPFDSKWGIVVNTWLATIISPVMTICLSMMASNVRGNTKKSTVSMMFFIAYCVGCIASPQLWNTDDAPRYRKGIITDIVSFALLIIVLVVHRFVLIWENRKRDAEASAGEIVAAELDDPTDKEDRLFRYTY